MAVQAEADRTTLAELFGGRPAISDPAGDALLNRLSPREREVLGLVVDGRSNAQIGRELVISLHTVRVHLGNIVEKLRVRSKLEAVAFALEHGWLGGGEELDALVDRVEDRRVIVAVRRLQPDQRDVLLLRMLSGLTVTEVAAVLGTTTGAVKALQHRGLASLARLLDLQDTE